MKKTKTQLVSKPKKLEIAKKSSSVIAKTPALKKTKIQSAEGWYRQRLKEHLANKKVKK